MNWTRVEAGWKDFKGKIRSEWGKLTGDDVENVHGKREQLVAKLQERYGIAKEDADRQIDRFLKRIDRGGKRPHPGA